MSRGDLVTLSLTVLALVASNVYLYFRLTRPRIGILARRQESDVKIRIASTVSGSQCDLVSSSEVSKQLRFNLFRVDIQNYETEVLEGPIEFRFSGEGSGPGQPNHSSFSGLRSVLGVEDAKAWPRALVGPDFHVLSWNYEETSANRLVVTADYMRPLKNWSFEIPLAAQYQALRIEVAVPRPTLWRPFMGTLTNVAPDWLLRNDGDVETKKLRVSTDAVSTEKGRRKRPEWSLFLAIAFAASLGYSATVQYFSDYFDGDTWVDVSVCAGLIAALAIFFWLLQRESMPVAAGYSESHVLTWPSRQGAKANSNALD